MHENELQYEFPIGRLRFIYSLFGADMSNKLTQNALYEINGIFSWFVYITVAEMNEEYRTIPMTIWICKKNLTPMRNTNII